VAARLGVRRPGKPICSRGGRGLTQVALCAGNTRLAARKLKEAGEPIPRTTLEDWKTSQVERYGDIWAEIVPRINNQIAAQSEAAAIREGEIAQQLTDKLEQEIPNLPARDLAGALRNTEVARGINLDKSLLLRGQPTQIIEHRPPNELYNQFARMTGDTVDGTAEEIEPAQQPTYHKSHDDQAG
jgi:hypothetical protein